MKESGSIYKILTGKPEKKRLMTRLRREWEGNIRIDIKDIVVSTRNWIDSAMDENFWKVLMDSALKLRLP